MGVYACASVCVCMTSDLLKVGVVYSSPNKVIIISKTFLRIIDNSKWDTERQIERQIHTHKHTHAQPYTCKALTKTDMHTHTHTLTHIIYFTVSLSTKFKLILIISCSLSTLFCLLTSNWLKSKRRSLSFMTNVKWCYHGRLLQYVPLRRRGQLSANLFVYRTSFQ